MKLRKVLSLIVAFAMIMTASTFATAFAFSDVDVDNEAYEAITALSALNILTGYEDGTFLPEGKVTRAEFATIIMRARGYDVKTTTNTIFDDVKADHWASGAIAEAFGAAIVNGRVLEYDADGNVIGGIFDPEAEVTYEEATKMIVCALGYDKMAVSMVKPGVNPFPTAYNIIANQKNITTDVEKTVGGASRATIARLVWNALPVNKMDQTAWGTDEIFQEDYTASLLWTNLDAVLIEEAKVLNLDLDPTKVDVTFSGVVIDDVSDTWINASNVNNVKKGACNLNGLQGLKVKALVDYSDKYDPTLIAVFPLDTNKTLEVKPTLFAGFTANNKFEYYKSMDTATTTSERVEFPFAVYSNLMNKGSMTADDTDLNVDSDGDTTLDATDGISDDLYDLYNSGIMNLGSEPNNSLYTFVDTDNNGYYDTLFIDNYASFVVARVRDNAFSGSNSTGDVFNSKVQHAAGLTNYVYNLDLDPEDDNLSWSLKDETGKDLTVADIAVGDVVTYAKSESGSYTYLDITVSKSSAIEGSVESKFQKTKNGITYDFFTVAGVDYLLNNTLFNSSLEVGDAGTFQITADGKIISIERAATARNFGVILKIADTGSNFSSGMAAAIAAADGTVSTINFADTYYIDGVKFTSTLAKTGTTGTMNDLDEVNTALSGDIAMYELNSDGQIKKIYTAGNIDTETNNKYIYKSQTGLQYDLAKGTLGRYYFNDDSKVITYGTDVTINVTATDVKDWVLYDDKSEYSLIGEASLEDEKTYSKVTTIVDENDNIVMAFIKDFTVLPSYDAIPAYITGTSVVSVDGESRQAITVNIAGEETTLTMAEDVTVVKMGGTSASDILATVGAATLNAGDAIQYTLNGDGEVNAYRHIVKVKDDKAHFLVHNAFTGADLENDNTAKAATLVAYSLTSTAVPAITGSDFLALAAGTPPTATGVSPATGVSAMAVTSTYGFGVAGRVHSLKGRNVNLYADFGTFSTTDYASGLVTIGYNDDLPLYATSTKYNDGMKVNYVSAFTTYKDGIGATDAQQLASADDVLYIFSYDDKPVFQYSLDLAKNNK